MTPTRLVPWILAAAAIVGCSETGQTEQDLGSATDEDSFGDEHASDGSRDGSDDAKPGDAGGLDGGAGASDAGDDAGSDGDDTQTPEEEHPPSVPTGLHLSREDPCQFADFAWNESTQAPEGAPVRGYQVYVDGVHRFTTLSPEQRILLSSYTYAPGTTYVLTVAAYAEDGAVSALSEPLAYTPGTCPYAPEPPMNVRAEVLGCREVMLRWEPATKAGPNDAVNGYEVRRDGAHLGTASTTQYRDFGMSPGETHRYTINTRSRQAKASDAVHLEVTLPACTDATPPSVPQDLRLEPAPNGTCIRARLRWEPATDDEGVHHYNLYRDGILVEKAWGASAFSDIFTAPLVTYRFEVTAVDNSGNESAPSNAVLWTPSCPKRTTPLSLRTAVLLGNFPDANDQPFSVSQATQVAFGAQGSFAAYMDEVSLGSIQIRGSAFGWYTLPGSVKSYCPGPKNASCNGHDAALMAAAASDLGGIGFDRYVRVYAGIGEAGFGGGDSVDLAHWAFDVGSIAHEIGHTLGLMHAGDLECTAGEVTAPNLLDLTQGGCKPSRYGDGYDVMGAANNGHFNTFNKELLGVIGPEQVAIAHESGTYTLTPAELGGEGIKELRIPLEINGFFYFLEYRKPTGFDGTNANPADGVQVRLHLSRSSGDSPTLRLHVLINPGSPFYDRYRKIRVEALEKTDDSVTLRVTR